MNGSIYSFSVIWSYSKSLCNWFAIYSCIFFAFFPSHLHNIPCTRNVCFRICTSNLHGFRISLMYSYLLDIRQNTIRLCLVEFQPTYARNLDTTLGSDRASSKGYIVRWVEAPSNKLLTTAFEASLESVTVTWRLSVDSKIAGIAMEHRNPKVSEGRHRGQGGRQYMHLSLWWDFACLCGVVETIHVRQGLYVNWRGPAFSFQSV